jgi:hypothetical protein
VSVLLLILLQLLLLLLVLLLLLLQGRRQHLRVRLMDILRTLLLALLRRLPIHL